MKYMLLIYIDPDRRPRRTAPRPQERHGAWMRVSEEMGPVDGVRRAAAAAPTTATTVRDDGSGEPVLTDGPFAETKEFLGGYYVIDVPDLDTATQWAAKLPNAGGGSVEVRPVMELRRRRDPAAAAARSSGPTATSARRSSPR